MAKEIHYVNQVTIPLLKSSGNPFCYLKPLCVIKAYIGYYTPLNLIKSRKPTAPDVFITYSPQTEPPGYPAVLHSLQAPPHTKIYHEKKNSFTSLTQP